MRNPTIPLLLVIAVMAGFYGGFKYSQSKLPATSTAAATAVTFAPPAGVAGGVSGPSGASGASGAGGGGGFGGGGRGGAAGAITAVGTGTLTIHDATANSDIKVSYSATTPIVKSSPGQLSDLTAGTNVIVTGQRGTDGTIAATAIQIGGPRAGG